MGTNFVLCCSHFSSFTVENTIAEKADGLPAQDIFARVRSLVWHHVGTVFGFY